MLMVMVAMETLRIFSHGILKYGPPGWNHAHLRVGVARLLLGSKRFGDRIVERRLVPRHAHRAAESDLHGTLVLVDCVNAHYQDAQHKPDEQSKQHSNQG